MELKIEGKKRTEKATGRALRREGLLPASLYGHDGANSVLLTVDAKEVSLMMRSVKVDSTPLELDVPEMPWKGTVVVKEAQKHPWRGYFYHISFCPVKDGATAEAAADN